MNGGAVHHTWIQSPGTAQPIKLKTLGLPVSQEALFLAEFVHNLVPSANVVLELGSGTGLISIVLSKLHPGWSVTGLEIQSELVNIAEENQVLNQCSHQLEFRHGNLKNPAQLPDPNTVDLVVANPPFRTQNSGKISPYREKSIACHELAASLQDYVACGARVLRHLGYFASVMIPERSIRFLSLLDAARLLPVAIQTVHHYSDTAANAVLILARKNARGGTRFLPPKILVQRNS